MLLENIKNTVSEKDCVSFETATLLHKMGYKSKSKSLFEIKSEKFIPEDYWSQEYSADMQLNDGKAIKAVTFNELIDYLRDTYGLLIICDFREDKDSILWENRVKIIENVFIKAMGKNYTFIGGEIGSSYYIFKNYRDAIDSAIRDCLKIIEIFK